MFKTYLKIVGLSLIPTLLLFLGKSTKATIWLQTNVGFFPTVDKDNLMLILFLVGILVTGLIIPFRLAYVSNKKAKLQKNYLKTLEFKKNFFTEAIKAELKQHNLHFNVRIFRRKKGILPFINHLLWKIVNFEIVNVAGLAENGNTDGLAFEVSPKSQGVVGKVYSSGKFVYDDEVDKRDQKGFYNLTDYQISKTNGVKFVLGVPLFSHKNKIDVIITVDSEDRVVIDKESKGDWKLISTRYCQSMHHSVPILLYN